METPGENPLAVDALWSIAAITVGALLVIPPFISEWRFYKRIGRAQALVGLDHPISPVTGLLLFTLGHFLVPIETAYSQRHLNRIWERQGRGE